MSCEETAYGIQRLRAWFGGVGFARHRHDTYAVGLTDSGVQSFWYRGTAHASTPGEVVVLHPDEPHDGYAGTAQGFGYRIAYVRPALVAEAVRAIIGLARGLPYVPRPVVRNASMRTAIEGLFAAESASLAADAFVLRLAEALLMESSGSVLGPPRVDEPAVERARQLLESETRRPVRSSELEAASGLSRFDLARQFRAHVGTSPYRYSLMRRLECARERIGARPTVELALEAGFADQAHFTRAFKSAFGMTPGRYAALSGGGA